MARGPMLFKQKDVTRLVKAATAAGMTVGRVQIDRDGRIVVETGVASAAAPAGSYDEWKAKRDARSS